MPAEVPTQFNSEPEFTLWRDAARLFEDYTGGQESFCRVIGSIVGKTPTTTSEFNEHEIRRALVGFCGADSNALLHYLAYSAATENDAAIQSGEVPETSTYEHLVDFQAAIMEWLDRDGG